MAGKNLLAPYIQQAYKRKLVDVPNPNEEQIFGHPQTAPRLDSSRVNQILVYPGSFNPPHRGHLHLLNHVFYHGVPDLNVVAAIVLPASDGSLLRKGYKHGTSLMFSREERCHLWKMDPNFPEWAWVFEDAEKNSASNKFSKFELDLKAAAATDGYKIEFISMFGADRMTPLSGAEPEHMTILCDASRVAEYQRSCGRLKDFMNFTPWKKLIIDRDQLADLHKAKAQRCLAALETTRPELAQKITEECPDYIENLTRARVAAATRDLQDVLHCQARYSGTSTLRFIKYNGDGPTRGNSQTGEKGTVSTKTSRRRKEISSTRLRKAMERNHGTVLKGKLDSMALSPGILWWHAPTWVGKARSRSREYVRFLPSPAQTTAGMGENRGENPRKRRASVAFAPEDRVGEGRGPNRLTRSV